MVDSWTRRGILSFCPIHQKIGQCLRLDSCSWLILDPMRGDLNCPLCHSAGCVSASHDVGQWSRADHGNRMGLKVGSQLLGTHVHSIEHFLVVWVVLLGRREYFIDVVHWALNRLCFVLFRTLYHHYYTDHPIGCRNV